MRSFVVSALEPITVTLRQVLLQEGCQCPPAHVLPLASSLQLPQGAELLVIGLSPDPERALAVLDQLRVSSHPPTLVVGPISDSKLVLRALRHGVRDYVNEADILTELPAAIRRLRGELCAPVEAGRMIAILAPCGGSGSSTLAVNVATLLAKEHKSALLVDLKLETGDLAALLDLRPTHTLAELCQNTERMDRIMFERSLAQHESGIRLLANPRSLVDVSHVTAEGVRQVLNWGRNLFSYVVLDLDHTFRQEQVQALQQADVILLVLRLDFTALRNTQRVMDHLARLGISQQKVRLVVNRYGQPGEVPAAKAEEALGLKIFHYVPDDPKTINRANNNGVPVVLESPWAKVSRSVAQLTVSVNGRHGKS